MSLVCALAFYCCCNNLPQSQWLKNKKNSFSYSSGDQISELSFDRSGTEIKVSTGLTLLKVPVEYLFFASPVSSSCLHSLAYGRITLISVYMVKWAPPLL